MVIHKECTHGHCNQNECQSRVKSDKVGSGLVVDHGMGCDPWDDDEEGEDCDDGEDVAEEVGDCFGGYSVFVFEALYHCGG